MAGHYIVRCRGGDGAGGFTDFDGDVLAVGQRHDDRRTGDWRADRRGVGDGATLSGGFGRGQFYRRGVDGVSDVGDGWNGAWHQIFEVAASRVFDSDFDFAGVLVDVIGRRRNGHGASGFARLDGDHRTVRQGHGYRGASRVGQGCGVNDRAAFSHGASGAERQAGGVGGVSHGGADRGFVGDEILVIAAGHIGDRVGQRRVAVQRVVWRGGGHGAGGFADFDGDVLAVGQGHDHWRTGDRRTHGSGVGDGTAFSGSLGGGQFDRRGVEGVSDVGDGGNGAWNEVLEVAARGVLDGDFDFGGVFIDVIGGCSDGHGAGGFTGFNGDHRTVRQGHGNRRACGVGQGRGVSDLTAFSHGACCAERQAGGVGGVSHGGADRGFVGDEVFVIAAAHARDRVGDRRLAGQRVIRCSGGHGAGGFADFDGDVLTIGQGHDNRRTGHRRANSGGIRDSATFSRRLGGGQLDRGGVNGIGHVGDGWNGARNEVLEIAAGSVLDGHFDLTGVFVDVIGRRRNGHGASGFAGFDGDHRTVRQGYGNRRTCGVGQGRGVSDLAAFSHRTGCAQRQVGGVGDIGNAGRNRGLVGHQIFVIATRNASDRIGQRRIAGQRIVRGGSGHGAGGFTDFNGDALTVGQGYHDRRTGHRRTDGGGVSDGATFSNRGISRQFHGRGVDGVGHFGHGRDSARQQILEVAARRILDRDFDFAGVFIDIICRRRNGHGASGFARLDGDHRAVAQGHGDWCAGRIGQGRGVNDRAAFSNAAGR
ncbi:hypothetical protein PS624_03294 [Pseudomonas fluorescens]|uniref:Uncharacterized protein n=1 Tax=Pseudomonas fluorescens TaxID=294 RepID=A0A5E6UAL7_PSEFL|nr:hypothetical protein PS624_03294 [Pseudomonas fluorescens]